MHLSKHSLNQLRFYTRRYCANLYKIEGISIDWLDGFASVIDNPDSSFNELKGSPAFIDGARSAKSFLEA